MNSINIEMISKEIAKSSFSKCPPTCSRCLNLLKNSSFEAGLAEWNANENTIVLSDFSATPFEGMQVIQMKSGEALLYQDVILSKDCRYPLLFSFNLFGSEMFQGVPTAPITAEVIWLDAVRQPIGNGLNMFIESGNITGTSNSRITYYDITDQPPTNAVFARVLFSKKPWTENSFLLIDSVILTPVPTNNLLNNPSFEAGLTSWNGPDFSPNFSVPIQGGGDVTIAKDGRLFQDVSLVNQPAGSPYLLGFTVRGTGLSGVNAQVRWLDAASNLLGPIGVSVSIPLNTLREQGANLSYLVLTDSAPSSAATARIIFDSHVIIGDENALKIDQVIFVRASTPNLIINPSFSEGFDGWTTVNGVILTDDDIYEGNAAASIPPQGGVLFQDIPISNNDIGHCFLFNCGFRIRRFGGGGVSNRVPIKVVWLGENDNEIGLGLYLLSFSSNQPLNFASWLVYIGITEPVPVGTLKARILFTKPQVDNSNLEVDEVVFGRLL